MAFLGNVSSCSELFFTPIFFPFSTIVYKEKEHWRQMVKNQKETKLLFTAAVHTVAQLNCKSTKRK